MWWAVRTRQVPTADGTGATATAEAGTVAHPLTTAAVQTPTSTPRVPRTGAGGTSTPPMCRRSLPGSGTPGAAGRLGRRPPRGCAWPCARGSGTAGDPGQGDVVADDVVGAVDPVVGRAGGAGLAGRGDAVGVEHQVRRPHGGEHAGERGGLGHFGVRGSLGGRGRRRGRRWPPSGRPRRCCGSCGARRSSRRSGMSVSTGTGPSAFTSRSRQALDCGRRGVAQLGSALALGARGRRFKSGHPDHVTSPDVGVTGPS